MTVSAKARKNDAPMIRPSETFRRPYHFGGSNKMIHPPAKSGSASKFRLHT